MDRTIWIKKGYSIVGGVNHITVHKEVDTYILTYNGQELMRTQRELEIDYCFRCIVKFLEEYCTFMDLDEKLKIGGYPCLKI